MRSAGRAGDMPNERLRVAMTAGGWTHATLADITGVDQKSVERWVNQDFRHTPRRTAGTPSGARRVPQADDGTRARPGSRRTLRWAGAWLDRFSATRLRRVAIATWQTVPCNDLNCCGVRHFKLGRVSDSCVAVGMRCLICAPAVTASVQVRDVDSGKVAALDP